jgi:Asp-tRNA(Asn)/Glu-tRNA(Gln) amidotransferase A subunit family amidase
VEIIISNMPASNINDLIMIPAYEQAKLVARREVSPVELCEAVIERIEKLDHRIGAFITVASEQALEAARASESRATSDNLLGPLDGVPVGIKDIEATAGIRTTLGSCAFEDTVPDFDSIVVERVRAAGMIVIGKTNTPEIAIHMGTVTDNDVRGPCRNPWDLTRTTAGSSGGSAAAIAADMTQIAIGSDGGGSIRIPASFCGVFGLKPSNGRVPRARGLGRPDPNQFSQSGPMANEVRDAALLLQAISGPHPADPQQQLRSKPPNFTAGIGENLKGLRVGFSSDLGYGAVDPQVLDQVVSGLSTFEMLGANVEESGIILGNDLADSFWKIFGANAYVQYGHLLTEGAGLLTEGVEEVLSRGREIAGHEYATALRTVADLRMKIDALFERFDIFVTPTTSVTAFEPGQRPSEVAGMTVDSAYGVFPFTYIFNMTGHPAASVPCGFVDGLPVGMQIVGRFGDERMVLRASAAFEGARSWRNIRPSL